MTKITIRQTEHIDEIALLDKVCFPDDLPEDFSTQMCWLATYQGEPVGFTAMRLEGHPAPSITRMGVLPEWRGFRLQRRLAAVCVKAATAHGFEAVYTYVSVYNTASLRSLIHAGFMPYACEQGWMQLGRWTKHKPIAERHAKFWPQF